MKFSLNHQVDVYCERTDFSFWSEPINALTNIAFLIAAALKTAQGSSTVAIITTAALIAPLMVNLGIETAFEKALAVLAVGAGALTVSHINDSYFSVVSQCSNLSVKHALKTHTVATFIQGITALLILLLIQLLFT